MLKLLAKPVIEKLRTQQRERADRFLKKHGRKPKLAVVLVGEDPASVLYTSKKGEACIQAGLDHSTLKLPQSSSSMEVQKVVQKLNDDPTVDGILIQRPLPKSFLESEVVYWIKPDKDVDAFHPENVGKLSLGLLGFRSCTPWGVMRLLEYYQISPSGKIACVLGRSSIVGKPMAALLLQADATVIQAHSKTKNLDSITRQADILVAAIGKPRFVTASFVKPGAVVIDVGISRDSSGKTVGDVDEASVSTMAHSLSPVPGGVGPMTIAMLIENTLQAAEAHC